MKYEDSHLSDQQLLLEIEGELPASDQKPVRAHVDGCWKCRARRQELEHAIADFVRVHTEEFDEKLPPAAGPRALLKARLAQISEAQPEQRSSWYAVPRGLGWAAVAGFLVLGIFVARRSIDRHNPSRARIEIVSIPDSRLTPGATLLVSRPTVCSQANVKNKAVPVALQQRVFEEYGIAGADPQAYEVDYLVTPALGGADDIHNLWPHSYSATIWNAQVKDALEDDLRDMVCNGSLDLAQAQREIATDWIAAYKKYFHTDKPLAEHAERAE
jgi:hypothetical protein